MTVDHVYDYLTQEPASARDVSFILVPSLREVKSALKLYDGVNQTINSFRGVPVFQAEDLSIDIENQVCSGVWAAQQSRCWKDFVLEPAPHSQCGVLAPVMMLRGCRFLY